MFSMTSFTHLLNLEKSIDPFTENKIKNFEEKNRRLLAKSNIDLDILKEGLHDLGITHDKFYHAYLSINIMEKDLVSIGGINQFIYLQNVNVSYNQLTSLEQLSGLKHLVKLNASHNKIEDLFDFDPPQNLELADYSHNNIKFIENIHKNKFLKVLVLNNNRISKIENLNENFYLENLDLSYNEIEIIENLDNFRLQRLNLMSNKIKAISGLENLETLLELNLSKNSISRLKGLQGVINLRYLYLSSNQISRAKQVAYISDLPFLTDVDFCFNDVQNRKFYRFQILFYLPQLRRLDGQDVTHLDKVKADILFGADSENKKEIFKTFLPDEQFIDRRLFVAEQIDPESDSEEDIDKFDIENNKINKNNKLTTSKNVTLSSIYDKRTKDEVYGDTAINGLSSVKIGLNTQ